MALTISQQPTSFLNSANNDSYFVVTGSSGFASSVEDFHYIADVYVNGNRACTLKTFPDPDFGYGVFNIRNAISSFVKYDFITSLSQDTASVFHTASKSSANVMLQFGKEFVHDNIFTQSRAEITSSTFAYSNAALPFTQQNTDLDNYVIYTEPENAKFLTNSNFTIPTYNNLRSYLYYYNNFLTSSFIVIETFDVNGNNLGIYSNTNPYSLQQGMQFIATGYPQLSLLSSGSMSTGSFYSVGSGNPVMFNPDVSTYKVFLDSFGIQITEVKTYQIMQDCTRFAPYAYKVYWLNNLGGFDSWLFNKSNLTTSNKKQSQFKKIPGKLSSNGSYAVNTYSTSVIPYYTEVVSKIQLSTDFLTDQHVNYLHELFSSPVIYLEDPNGVLISATVDTSDYTLNKRAINSKVYALSLTFIPSNADYRQQL